jgi:hypothetical protein
MMYQQQQQPVMMMAPQMAVLTGPTDLVMTDMMTFNGAGGNGACVVKQLAKPWLYECCCPCLVISEFNIADFSANYSNWFAPQFDKMYALESSHWCCRFWCGPRRPAEIDVARSGGRPPSRDNIDLWSQYMSANRIAVFNRPFRMQPGSCCCQQEISVMNKNREFVGSSYIPFYCCIPQMIVRNKDLQPKYHIEAQCCNFWGRQKFNIYPAGVQDRQQFSPSFIQKEWGGMYKELCTQADNFSIVFPMDADNFDKANLLGATFLLDYNYFSRENHNDDQGMGGMGGLNVGF